LLQCAGLGEVAVVGGELGLAAVLGDDQCIGCEDGEAAGAAEKVQGVGVLGFGLPGWVEVDEVE
jgi:hypothetical protein